jgi:hypothetical protein
MFTGADKATIAQRVRDNILASFRQAELSVYKKMLIAFNTEMHGMFKDVLDKGDVIWDDETKSVQTWQKIVALTATPPTNKEDLLKIGNYCAQLYNMWDEIPE